MTFSFGYILKINEDDNWMGLIRSKCMPNGMSSFATQNNRWNPSGS